MLAVVRVKTRILWVFHTAYKRAPVIIIRFVLIPSNIEKHPWRCMRVDKDGALSKSTDVTNLLVDDFSISIKTSGGGVAWLNKKNERRNKNIYNMFIAGLLDSNQHFKNGAAPYDNQLKYIDANSTVP